MHDAQIVVIMSQRRWDPVVEDQTWLFNFSIPWIQSQEAKGFRNHCQKGLAEESSVSATQCEDGVQLHKRGGGRRDGERGGTCATVCGALPGGELTAWQSVGTGEQSRAGRPGEHYHLLQDNATYVVGASHPPLGT